MLFRLTSVTCRVNRVLQRSQRIKLLHFQVQSMEFKLRRPCTMQFKPLIYSTYKVPRGTTLVRSESRIIKSQCLNNFVMWPWWVVRRRLDLVMSECERPDKEAQRVETNAHWSRTATVPVSESDCLQPPVLVTRSASDTTGACATSCADFEHCSIKNIRICRGKLTQCKLLSLIAEDCGRLFPN